MFCDAKQYLGNWPRLGRFSDGSKIELPRALLGRKDCDFSFSGLKTAAFRVAQTCESDQDKADLADAVQKAIARQLSERSERAASKSCASR